MVVEKRKPIPIKEAVERIVKQNIYIPQSNISLEDSLGYVLAEDIVATYDIPRFNKSPYDGFAIRSEDSAGAFSRNRKTFRVIDHVGAGAVSHKTVGENEAVRIMTGAQIPEGADAVVTSEQAVENGDTFTIRKPFGENENVSLKGEETETGDIASKKGQVINPGTITVLATYGYTGVPVFLKPSITVITTGSELLNVDEELQPGKIRSSNGPMIQALADKMGLTIEPYSIQQDDLEGSVQVITKAMKDHDIVITTGGALVGDYDFLSKIYKAIQAEVLFNKIVIRPGSVAAVAVANSKYLFDLLGNPSACFTGFELFVKPAVQHMMQAKAVYPQVVKATLMEDFAKVNPFIGFIRATASFTHNCATVVPSGFNKSGAVIAVTHSNAMIMLSGGTRGFKAGHTVDVILTESDVFEEELSL